MLEFEAGATLWFAVGGGVLLKDCTNVSLVGAVVDYKATYAQGSVVQMSTTSAAHPRAMGGQAHAQQAPSPWVVADFDDDWMMPDYAVEPFFALPYNHTVKVVFWDSVSKTMMRGNNLPTAINLFMRSSKVCGPMQPCTHQPMPCFCLFCWEVETLQCLVGKMTHAALPAPAA